MESERHRTRVNYAAQSAGGVVIWIDPSRRVPARPLNSLAAAACPPSWRGPAFWACWRRRTRRAALALVVGRWLRYSPGSVAGSAASGSVLTFCDQYPQSGRPLNFIFWKHFNRLFWTYFDVFSLFFIFCNSTAASGVDATNGITWSICDVFAKTDFIFIFGCSTNWFYSTMTTTG